MAYENGKTYWICPEDNTNVALSVYGNRVVSQNRNVFLYAKQDVADQRWLVDVDSKNGFARLKTELSSSYALNIYRGTSNYNNCDIHTWSDNQEDSKIDFLTIDASKNLYYIKSYRNNGEDKLFLTADSASSGSNVYWALQDGNKKQRWKLIKVTSGGDTGEDADGGGTCKMPVNVNQKYKSNSTGVRNTGCALCCGVDLASFKKGKNYTIADFEGHYFEGVDSKGVAYAYYNWTAPDGVGFTDAISLASLNEAQTIQKIRSYVSKGTPVACHAMKGSNEHWFVAYDAAANGGSTWSTCGITVLDPVNDKEFYSGRRVAIWTAMSDSYVTAGIDRIRLLK